MNYSNAPGGSDSSPPEIFPGLEHADVRYAEDDLGATWIGDLITAVRRHGFKLALWVVFCFFAGFVHTLRTKPEYIASARVALEPRVRIPSGADAAAAAAAAAPILDSAQAESQLLIIRSVRNLKYVFDILNLENDPAFLPSEPGIFNRSVKSILGQLLFSSGTALSTEQSIIQTRDIAFQNFSDRVQARRLGQSYVIEVSFQGTNPDDTARITNSIAAAYIRDQVLVHAISEQRGTEFLQGRITLVQAEKKAADEAVATGIITDFQFPDSDARIIGAALKPLIASYPQTKLNLLFSLIFGFVSGVVYITISNNFDNTVRSSTQIRRIIGIDCLILVPRLRSGRISYKTVLDQPNSDFARSLRLLRTVIFGERTKTGQLAIGFVSCQEGDGCSTLCANFASLLAASKSQVALIDASLQKPDLTRGLAPRSEIGLDRFISSSPSDASLPEVILSEFLSFVPATSTEGRIDPNTFLGSQALRRSISDLNNRKDLIIDLPSLETSSDAQSICDIFTGVILIASINRTKLYQISEVVRALRSTNSRILGVVLNDPPRRRNRRSGPTTS